MRVCYLPLIRVNTSIPLGQGMAIIIIVRLMMTSMTTMMRVMMPIGIAHGKKGGYQIMAKSKLITRYTPFVPCDNLTNLYLGKPSYEKNGEKSGQCPL